jgi:hypothetical protein
MITAYLFSKAVLFWRVLILKSGPYFVKYDNRQNKRLILERGDGQ